MLKTQINKFLTGVIIIFALLPMISHRALAEKEKFPLQVQFSDGGGMGFDDINFASKLNKLLVPGGQTGQLFFVNP